MINPLSKMRQSSSIRHLMATPPPSISKMIWPVFLVSGKKIKSPLPSLPNQFYYSADKLLIDLEPLVSQGLGGIMLFATIDNKFKTDDAKYAYDPKGIVQIAIKQIKSKFPQLVIFTDVCICGYTLNGHCAIANQDNTNLDFQGTLPILSKIALSHAQAGADGVAPSAMMDGQIEAISNTLHAHGFAKTLLMSYSTKFASSMYGPFRDVANSAPSFGDRRSYQCDYQNLGNALLESMADEYEGADILMVKPALFYLDIIAEIKRNTHLPLAVYNVSGEYAMLVASAQNQWGDLYPMVRESLCALSRAGADIIITYWANQYDLIFGKEK